MTRSIRRCPRCLGRDGEHYPECSIPALAALTERAETPDAPPQTETLWARQVQTRTHASMPPLASGARPVSIRVAR